MSGPHEARASGAQTSRALAAAALAPLLACGAPELIIALPEVPTAVDRMAALLADDAGAIVGSSGLVAVDDGVQRFELDEGVDEASIAAAWVIGHDPRSLPSSVRPDAATLASARLRVVGPLDHQLGPPAWVARGARDGTVIAVRESADAPPLLGASWLDRCPLLFGGAPALVDIGCKEQVCPASAEQVGCSLVIDAERCTYGRPVAEIGADGELVVDSSSPFGRCDPGVPGPDRGSLQLVCDLQSARQCPITLYPSRAPDRFAVTSIELGSGRTRSPAFTRPPAGYLPAAALVEGALFVSVLSSAASGSTCQDVSSGLARIDLATRALVATSTAPDCLVGLATDPSGSGLLGVFHDGAWRLASLDARGRVTRARDLGWPADAALVAVAADPVGARDARLLLVSRTASVTASVLIDPRTLEPQLRVETGEPEPRAAVLTPTTFAILDDLNDQLFVYARGTGARVRREDVRGDSPNEDMALLRASGSDFLITASGRRGGIKVVRPGMLRPALARPYEAFVQSYGLGPWGPAPDTWVVGLTGLYDDTAVVRDPERVEAYVALLDPATPRLLPRMQLIGRGPVDHVIAAPDGSGTWVALPWESRVVFLSPP